jgi:hypothetical protein
MSFLQHKGLGGCSKFDGIALGFLSLTILVTVLFVMMCTQKIAQRPARQGVMTIHLGRSGDLRLWNQPIRLDELSEILDRAQLRGQGASSLVIRLIPDSEVSWGVVQIMLSRLQPRTTQQPWTLQLQLP